jgi:hypothetical protein
MNLHSKEFHISYLSPDIIRQIKSRRMRYGGHVTCMGEDRKVYKVLVGKSDGKRPLKRPGRKQDDRIRMDVGELACGGKWIQLAQDRDQWRVLVNAVMKFQVLAPQSWLLLTLYYRYYMMLLEVQLVCSEDLACRLCMGNRNKGGG